MNQASILFVTEGGRNQGMGHMVRCAHIAHALAARGATITLAVNSEAFERADLFPNNTKLIEFGEQECLIDKLPIVSWTIIDSFRLGVEFEKQLKSRDQRVAAIDGLLREHEVDLLIDPIRRAPDVRRAAGQMLGTVCEGPQHIPIDPAFSRIDSLRTGQSVSTLGISLGGGDVNRDVSALLDALTGIGFLGHVHAVCEPGLVSRQTLKLSRVAWVSNMIDLVAKCDAFIGNCGMSAWERSAAGCPSLNFLMADNQKYVASTHQSANAALVEMQKPSEIAADDLGKIIAGFLQDADRRAALSKNARQLCDGQGTVRIAEALLRAEQGGF